MKIRLLHKDIYVVGNNLPKRNKLGIHKNIEELCLLCLSCAIDAAFRASREKFASLQNLRVKVSVLKNLIRTEYELKLIPEKTYVGLESQAVEISKMTNGWINYISQKGA